MKAFKILAFSIFFGASLNAQVGFGTTSPSNDIDVESSSATATAVDINNTGGGDPKINLQLNGTTNFSIGIDNSDSDKLKIGTTAPETNTRVTIDNTGNVGIGTTTPSYKLDVNGDIRIPQNYVANGVSPSLFFFSNPGFESGGLNYVGGPSGNEQNGSYLSLYTDGTSRMSILKGGNVGIGTTTPNAALQLGNVLSNRRFVLWEFANNDHQFLGFGINDNTLRYQVAGSGDAHVFYAGTSSTTSNELMRIQGNGNVGIGTSSPGYKLTVNGQPGANGYTAFTNYSDSRLKTNISSLDTGALSKILQLRPVSFQYNQKYLQLYPNSDLQKVHKGFIAQEIRTVFPEMVSEMKASPDSVQYLDLDVSHLQVYLVKAMQEQQAIIQEQQAIIESLKKANEEQNAKAMLQKAEMAQNAIKVAELENKMNAMLLLLNNKTELTVKQ